MSDASPSTAALATSSAFFHRNFGSDFSASSSGMPAASPKPVFTGPGHTVGCGDAGAAQFLSHCLGVGQHESLGRTVRRLPWYGTERSDRRDVKHCSASALDHSGDEPAAEVDHGSDVNLDQVEFGPRIRIGDRTQRGEPRVIDQHFRYDTESRHLVGQSRALFAVREIGSKHVCHAVEFFRQFPQTVGPAGDEDQSITAAGEFADDLLADSRRRTGDDDGAVVACRREHGAENSLTP